MGRILATVAAVENQKVFHIPRVCVCSFRHPAWNAYAPYYHMWPAQLCSIFPNCPINSALFEKKNLLKIKVSLVILYNFFSETFLILKRTELDKKKCTGVHVKHPLFLRTSLFWAINPLNAELNPICHLLALLWDATIVVVSRLRVKQRIVVITDVSGQPISPIF